MPHGTEVDLVQGHIEFDRNPVAYPPPKKRAQQPSIFGPCLLWQSGGSRCHLVGRYSLGLGHIALDGDPALPKKGLNIPTHPHFSAHVYCGETAGRIKTPLGTEVDLGLDHIVLDGTQLPPKGVQQPPLSARVYYGQTVAHLCYCWALVLYVSTFVTVTKKRKISLRHFPHIYSVARMTEWCISSVAWCRELSWSRETQDQTAMARSRPRPTYQGSENIVSRLPYWTQASRCKSLRDLRGTAGQSTSFVGHILCSTAVVQMDVIGVEVRSHIVMLRRQVCVCSQLNRAESITSICILCCQWKFRLSTLHLIRPTFFHVLHSTAKFLQKYKATENRICILFGHEVDRQLRTLCTIM